MVEGAATNIGVSVTVDNGLTWRSGLLPGLTDASVPAGVNERASDPVVAFDARHGAWLISSLALGDGVTRLAINRSPDGATWSGAVNAAEETGAGGDEGVAFDKNWIACDNTASSPFYGRCYLVYTHSDASDMSTSSAPSSTTARVSASLISVEDWPDGNAVATDATFTPLPASRSFATPTRLG